MLTALTLGNFDGVHRGHQKLIESLLEWKRRQSLPVETLAITFEPHPREILQGTKVMRLSSPNEKASLLSRYGIDRVQIIDFTPDFSKLSANAFLEEVVFKQRHPVGFLAVGDNFSFGYQREGGPDFLKQWCQSKSIELKLLRPIEADGAVISSSRIRQHLERGEVTAAARLLGRNFSIEGVVNKGHQQGRILGFPTANILAPSPEAPLQLCLPARGVYLTTTTFEGQSFPSVTNIGIKPTLGPGHPLCIETHLLNYSGTLYEKMISVEFIDRIREEKRFASLDELREQIQKDILFAKARLHTS
jgi:riboflavin kinase/FMN adenylyltransferase